MGFKRKTRILAAGKSPSLMAMKRTYNRAVLNGGVTQDLAANVENIREISRKLGYNILSDATYVYVPSSYGEGKNFAQVQNKRNLVQFSDAFDNASWSKASTIVSANTTANPIDGLATADKLFETNVNSTFRIISTVTMVAGQLYTFSAYVKKYTAVANERRYCCLQLIGGSDILSRSSVIVDTQTGLITNSTNINTASPAWVLTSNITEINGYYRISITGSAPTGTVNGSGLIALSDSATPTYSGAAPLYTGNALNFITIWGSQLETGAYATPYQKTVAAGDGIVDFNFTRATSSTVTNKQGVIEDSCYNLAPQSENFTTGASWFATNATSTSTSNLNYFGRNTTYRLRDDTNNSAHSISPSFNVVAGQVYTAEIYIRKDQDSWVQFLNPNSSFGLNVWVNFNFDTGLFGQSGANGIYTKTALTNGWWRITMTATATGTATSSIGTILGTNNTDSVRALSYIGTSRFFCEICGFQLVLGSTPRPYLRTTNRLNVPKLDYSRSLLEPSLLIEPQRTNLALWSEDLTNAAWVKTNTTISANTTTAPDGNTTADKLVETTANAQHRLHELLTAGTGFYSASVYVKKSDRDSVYFEMNDNTSSGISGVFTFSTLSFTSNFYGSNWSNQSISSYDVGNGWYRLVVTGNKLAGTSVIIQVLTYNGGTTYVGDITKGVYVWGAQLEAGSNATTYIPTSTATVTRNGETSYTDLYNNSLLEQNNFTLFVEGYLYANATTNLMVGLSDTTATGSRANDIGFFDGVKATYAVASTITSDTSNLAVNSAFKFVIQRSGTSVKFFRNGSQAWATQTITSINYRYLVVNSGGSNYMIDKIMLFNRTLVDADCVLLTT